MAIIFPSTLFVSSHFILTISSLLPICLSPTYTLEMEKFRPIKADIALAIDTAVGDEDRTPEILDFKVIQHFVRKVTTALPVSLEDSRIAVIEFAAAARVRLSLKDGTDEKALDAVYADVSDWYDEEGIDRRGAVDYQTMFKKVYEEVFVEVEGDRLDVPNLLIVMTIVPSFEKEDSTSWRRRSRLAAKSVLENFSNPHGVVVTTSYAALRGLHLPKFTVTRGIGTFDADAWYYQDFEDVLHYAIIHLRHAVRAAWVDAFYTEAQIRRMRSFDYTTCRIDPALAFKVPDAEELRLLAADLILATGDPSTAGQQEIYRTFLLNMTRHLPISPNVIHVLAVEFDREIRVLSCDGATPCANQSSLFKTLVEKWASDGIPQIRPQKDRTSANGTSFSLKSLRKNIQKILKQSGRVPQLLFATVVFPQTAQISLSTWFSDFVKGNGRTSADALIITSANKNHNTTYTVLISPLLPNGPIEIETATFGGTRGKLLRFILNVTKAAVRRCHKCFYAADGQCLISDRTKRLTISGIEFTDGVYCKNVSGLSLCPNELLCVSECERRPWSEWSDCWPATFRHVIYGIGIRRRRRIGIDSNDTDTEFYRNCPLQEKLCSLRGAAFALALVSFIAAFFSS